MYVLLPEQKYAFSFGQGPNVSGYLIYKTDL